MVATISAGLLCFSAGSSAQDQPADAPAARTQAGADKTFPSFDIWFDEATLNEPVSGRLLVYLIQEGSQIGRMQQPTNGPFWHDPQPIFGLDVHDLKPGQHIIVDDANSLGCPVTLNDLQEGQYRVQVLLDVNRENSDWKAETGNLTSSIFRVYINGADGIKDMPDASATEYPYPLRLERIFESPVLEGGGGKYEPVSIPSKILSDFRGSEVMLKAAVIPPLAQKPGLAYPAIYEVPGFGGGGLKDAHRFTHARSRNPGFNALLNRSAYRIIIDPEGPNGHNLCADSINNGPVARAIIEELIPHLESKYPLIARPEARLLEGHSSGGWSVIWLAMNYPETFGAAWSTAPDPVDFRAFQISNIYEDPNMYLDGEEVIPAFRDEGEAQYSVALENGYEEVLGPGNTSAQQWDSWQAVFGPKDDKGNPAALYDAASGEIDHAIAEQYRPYDIADLLRKSPDKYGPVFKSSIRIRVGTEDNYYLNNAVEFLKESLATLGYLVEPQAGALNETGYVEIVPRLDHGSVNDFDWKERMGEEMIAHLKKAGVMPTRTATEAPSEPAPDAPTTP